MKKICFFLFIFLFLAIFLIAPNKNQTLLAQQQLWVLEFEWGEIIAEVSGNQVRIYNTSDYAWATGRSKKVCPPPSPNEPHPHEADWTERVEYSLDGGGWNSLSYSEGWNDKI